MRDMTFCFSTRAYDATERFNDGVPVWGRTKAISDFVVYLLDSNERLNRNRRGDECVGAPNPLFFLISPLL